MQIKSFLNQQSISLCYHFELYSMWPAVFFLTLYSWLFIFITPYIYCSLFTVASGVTCHCSQLLASFALLYVAPSLCYISLSLSMTSLFIHFLSVAWHRASGKCSVHKTQSLSAVTFKKIKQNKQEHTPI